MKVDNISKIINEELNNETMNLTMSNNLKEKIRLRTTKKPKNIFEKINTFLNKSIELPVIPFAICILVVVVLLYLPFKIPRDAAYYKSIIGCTEYRVIEFGNMSIIVNKDFKGDVSDENN